MGRGGGEGRIEGGERERKKIDRKRRGRANVTSIVHFTDVVV